MNMTKNLSPQESLEELIAGNKRYIANESYHYEENAIRRQHTATHGQYPIAIVLACSDSRMPVETLLDQGNGDIFVIRVAGNIVGDQVLGSIDYALKYLDVPLILVLGHTLCGAIYSAVDAVYSNTKLPHHIKTLLNPLLDLVHEKQKIQPNPTEDEVSHLKNQIIIDNIFKEIHCIKSQSVEVKQRLKEKKLLVTGALYNIQSGEVEWFN